MRTRVSPRTANTIYWPIETKVRELDASLLFAVLAAQRGWSVVVGGKTELYRRLKQNAEPGIVVDKSIQKGSEGKFRMFKDAGHRVFARCEEGLWFATPEDYCNRKTGKEAFGEIDGFFAWGREHADALVHVYPQYAHKVTATGNVRLDLMHSRVRGLYAEEVARIRGQWGEFYLLNTKLAKVNNVRQLGYLESHIAKGHAPTAEQIRLTSKRVDLEKALLPHVIDFVTRFAAELPGKQLIIRPHPAEDFSLWERLAAGKPNVQVVHQGNVHPWLLACKLSISSDCTTSLETFLLDKPGINFRPVEDEEVEWIVPRVAAYQVTSTDALISALAADDPSSVLSLPDAPIAEVVRRYVAQYGGPTASDVILDQFVALHGAGQNDALGHNPLGRRNLGFIALQRLKVFVAWCISEKNRARHRNREHKFRGLNYDEIATRVAEICRALGCETVGVNQVDEHIFHVSRRSAAADPVVWQS
jgi:surface carbohydrate biosynthesis protein